MTGLMNTVPVAVGGSLVSILKRVKKGSNQRLTETFCTSKSYQNVVTVF